MNARSDSIDIAIIGSGFAGLCMAIKLKEAGFTDFFIAEQADSLGGTWRTTTTQVAPAMCSPMCIRFPSRPTRTGRDSSRRRRKFVRTWSNALRALTWRLPAFDMGLVRAVFDEARQRWQLNFSDGSKVSARVLVSGMGGLSRRRCRIFQGWTASRASAFTPSSGTTTMP